MSIIGFSIGLAIGVLIFLMWLSFDHVRRNY